MTDLREELIRLIKGHDWYYQRSDDHGVFTAGREAALRIASIIRQLPDGIEIYNATIPCYISPMVRR